MSDAVSQLFGSLFAAFERKTSIPYKDPWNERGTIKPVHECLGVETMYVCMNVCMYEGMCGWPHSCMPVDMHE